MQHQRASSPRLVQLAVPEEVLMWFEAQKRGKALHLKPIAILSNTQDLMTAISEAIGIIRNNFTEGLEWRQLKNPRLGRRWRGLPNI